MSAVVIIGLIVAVLALSFELARSYKTITQYEKELISKARKGKKNATKSTK